MRYDKYFFKNIIYFLKKISDGVSKMRLPILIISVFALVVVIIPLGIVEFKGSYISTDASVEENSQVLSPPWAVPIPEVEEAEQEYVEVEDAVNEEEQLEEVEDAKPAPEIEVEEEASETLAPMYDTDYFEILNLSTGAVDRVDIEEYVMGAVAAEMPASFHSEALKAQAVAARTYAIRLRYNNILKPDPSLQGADFSADPVNRKGYMDEATARDFFGADYELYWGKISDAVYSVKDEVLTYNSQPIVAAYHAASAGITEDAANVWVGSADYLLPVESEGDLLSPNFETEVAMTESELKEKMQALWPEVVFGDDANQWILPVETSEGGYVVLANVGGVMLSGLDIREALDLRSSAFEVRASGGNIIFTVKGYGHGVGLSQYGADYMARQGYNYEEILMHYYTDAVITMRE